MPNEDELNLKSMLSDFSRKSKGSYKFSVIIENNLELLESINKREGLSWSEIHRISEIPQSFLTFQGTIYRARKKRSSGALVKSQYEKEITAQTSKESTIKKISDKRKININNYNFPSEEKLKPTPTKITKNDNGLKFSLDDWMHQTGLNKNMVYLFKDAEINGLEPKDFENIPMQTPSKQNTAFVIFERWEKICSKEKARAHMHMVDFIPPSVDEKNEFLKKYR